VLVGFFPAGNRFEKFLLSALASSLLSEDASPIVITRPPFHFSSRFSTSSAPSSPVYLPTLYFSHPTPLPSFPVFSSPFFKLLSYPSPFIYYSLFPSTSSSSEKLHSSERLILNEV